MPWSRRRNAIMASVTIYRLVRHSRSQELWALRLEAGMLTGAYGPIPEGSVEPLAELVYEDHPDDLDWIARAWENFDVVREVE